MDLRQSADYFFHISYNPRILSKILHEILSGESGFTEREWNRVLQGRKVHKFIEFLVLSILDSFSLMV